MQTSSSAPHQRDAQYQHWNTVFANSQYFYGEEPGPVARRAVRYHRQARPQGGTAVDFGCGEGQDLAFLVEHGYAATGYELTAAGVEKTQKFLQQRNLTAQVKQADLRNHVWDAQFDVVLSINALQFLGEAAPQVLTRVFEAVAPAGVIGLSLFAREDESTLAVQNGIYYPTLREVMAQMQSTLGQWQMLEAAQLWQWNRTAQRAQMFVTLVAERVK
jgi:cyclopropane fatty-acyl-phospholipid synthase-like methyltransferase